jgi:hypothetical protein
MEAHGRLLDGRSVRRVNLSRPEGGAFGIDYVVSPSKTLVITGRGADTGGNPDVASKLAAGDEIVAVNGQPVAELELAAVKQLFAANNTVALDVQRGGCGASGLNLGGQLAAGTASPNGADGEAGSSQLKRTSKRTRSRCVLVNHSGYAAVAARFLSSSFAGLVACSNDHA